MKPAGNRIDSIGKSPASTIDVKEQAIIEQAKINAAAGTLAIIGYYITVPQIIPK